ncbi:hypothetical protein [Maritimibacter fusiformis]|uniref:EF-hand domain-containing protein n=1 Tax=Maritimibacter fusiformis TaxID=2603819 RepID=A0A5D0RAB0_9RHOB|nr:hypothetical protein [Maritimibacter fusiformis]TYB77534.1 hypothetical protein FVF75_14795 [Maritimibacter fusiformis]
MKRTALALGIIVAGTSPLMAQEMLDANEDGFVSLVELQATYPDVTEADFTEADANGDGLLDEEELAAAREAGLIPMAEEEDSES